jgi:hypothetical protein
MPLSLLADDNERTLVQPHEALGAGLPGSSFGPAMYSSSDIDM